MRADNKEITDRERYPECVMPANFKKNNRRVFHSQDWPKKQNQSTRAKDNKGVKRKCSKFGLSVNEKNNQSTGPRLKLAQEMILGARKTIGRLVGFTSWEFWDVQQRFGACPNIYGSTHFHVITYAC